MDGFLWGKLGFGLGEGNLNWKREMGENCTM